MDMSRIRWRWAGVGILFLIGLGAEIMPDVRDWLASGIIWGIAFVWLIVTIIYWRKHGKTVDKIKQPKLSEIRKWVKQRKEYLPQLKQLFGDYINRVEILAKTDGRLCDLKQYKRFYPIGKFYIFLSRGDDKASLLGQLHRKQVWADNIVLRQVEDEDTTLRDISIRMDNLATNVRDKTVKNYATGVKKAAHTAYSYVVYCDLITKHYEEVPFGLKFHFNQMRNMIDKFRQHQSNINTRIDELLEGVPDDE